RTDREFHATDLLTDVLSAGKSARLYNSLVKDQQLFTDINAYTLGDLDPSLIVAQGNLRDGVKFEDAEHALNVEMSRVCNELISDDELERIHNKAESTNLFGETSIANRALNLCYYEMNGDANEANNQVSRYRSTTPEMIRDVAKSVFRNENSSTLIYLPQN
ncbi:MAG: M16 family metallopeptidase, partial [Bacteroidota bacterium]